MAIIHDNLPPETNHPDPQKGDVVTFRKDGEVGRGRVLDVFRVHNGDLTLAVRTVHGEFRTVTRKAV